MNKKNCYYEQANLHLPSLNMKCREKCVIRGKAKSKIVSCLREKGSTTADFDSRSTSSFSKFFIAYIIRGETILYDGKSKNQFIFREAI